MIVFTNTFNAMQNNHPVGTFGLILSILTVAVLAVGIAFLLTNRLDK